MNLSVESFHNPWLSVIQMRYKKYPMQKFLLTLSAFLLVVSAGVAGCDESDDTSPSASGDPDQIGDADESGPGGDPGDSDDAGVGDLDEGGDAAGDRDSDPDREQIETVWPNTPDDWISDPAREPENVHLTWQNSPAETLTVLWKIDDTDLSTYAPRVWFAAIEEAEENGSEIVLPFAASYTAEGSCRTYKEEFSFLKSNRAGEESEGLFVACEVELRGLDAATGYYYRAGSWDGFDYGERAFVRPNLAPLYDFRTGIAKGSTRPFTFMAAGDSRGGCDEIEINIDRLKEMNAEFWLFSGDMTEFGTQNQWDEWFAAMGPLMHHTVLMPVQGNHEILAGVYYNQFALPIEADLLPVDIKEHAWSFDYGNVHFVGLNSNTRDVAEAQKAWLEADLAAVESDGEPAWKIVMFHYPAYSDSKHGSTEWVQEHWLPIFESYNVDLCINGHDHNYERTKPIRNDQVVESGGIVYVVAGAFFAPAYGNGEEWWTEVSHHGDKGNYVFFEVSGDTIKATAYSGDGSEILDEFTLSR